MAIQILIADNHEVVRAGIKSMLKDTDIRVVVEAENGNDVLSTIGRCELDLALLDVSLPDIDGLNCLARIKVDEPDLPVVMFTTHNNPTYIARAVALGASGYVLKSVDRKTLIDKICDASRGESIWTHEELRRVTGALMTPRVPLDVEAPLTRRENEVLKQLAFGLTNKEIARALGISYETVKEHVQHILRKIGVSDRTQAAVWAVRKGLV
jgi:DNA-binding NarL/FixJ family response regulator